MADSAEEKSEAATPRRRSDARKRGQTAKSMELSSMVVLLGVIMFIGSIFGGMSAAVRSYFTLIFSHLDNTEMSVPTAMHIGSQLFSVFVHCMWPLCITAMVLGILANVLQTGFLWSTESLTPKLEKLNPMAGFSRLFSARSLVELFKSLYKVGLVSWIAWGVLKNAYPQLMSLSRMEVSQGIGFLAELMTKMSFRVVTVMLILAAGDYFYQRYTFEKSIKMSKQEVKQEHKQMESDPQIKAKIRQKQREAARKRMMADVPMADVVVTNPTHFAVALKYDASKGNAPIVVAKGADLVAFKIREIATENDVPIVENKPLARALFKQVEIGQPIPGDMFEAVAELLAYVYRMNEERKRRMATAYGL